MHCTTCGTPAAPGQKFCANCGSPLPAAAPLPPPAPTPAAAPPPPAIDPTFAATSALNVVEQTGQDHAGWQAPPQGGAWNVADTGEQMAYSEPTAAFPGVVTDQHGLSGAPAPTSVPFAPTPLFIASCLTALLAVAACFVKVWSYAARADGADLFADDGKINYLASNNIVAVVIAAVLMVGGAALGATGRRFGSGLAGGAGLALVGFVLSWVVGFTAGTFDAADIGAQLSGATSLSTTLEVGYFLFVAAAVLGAVVFVLSLQHQGADGRNRINQGIAAVGALAVVALVVGPLIPTNGASFSDNFDVPDSPPIVQYMRLALLALVLVAGLWGFFHGRRWGVGLALGGASMVAYQWLSTQAEFGDLDIGPAFGNPGATDTTPHIVTAIGAVGVVVVAVVALIAASQAAQRH